jgi:hypothetical protein
VRGLWRWLASRFDARRLVFVDESGFHTSMTRLRARAPRGKRAYGARCPEKPRQEHHSLIAAIIIVKGAMGQSMTVDGATDALAFEVYVEHFLAPSLEKGQVVVLEDFPQIVNPYGVDSPLVDVVTVAASFLVGASMVASAISMIVRLRRAGRVERQQIKWLAYGGAVVVGAIFVAGVIAIWSATIGTVIIAAALLGLPISTGIAIVRHRLYDIDVVINRTLVYGALTTILAVIYFSGFTATQAVFRALTGQEQQPQLAIVISTLVIAALFNPLRRRIQAFTDRRFYRSRYDARKTLEAFSAKLRDETDLEALNNELLGVVRQTMQPAHVSLWLRPETTPKSDQVD